MRIQLGKLIVEPTDRPKDLHDLLSTFTYGYKINGTVITKDFSKYLTISPDKIIKTKTGVCWDYVAFEDYIFKNFFKKYDYTLYYIEDAGSHVRGTHTWLAYNEYNKIKVIEASWYKHSGIREYNSEKEMLDDYTELFFKDAEGKAIDGVLYSFKQPSKYDLSPEEYMNYIYNRGKKIK